MNWIELNWIELNWNWNWNLHSPKREAGDSLLRSTDSSPHSAGDSGLATTTTTTAAATTSNNTGSGSGSRSGSGSGSLRTKFSSAKLSSSGSSKNTEAAAATSPPAAAAAAASTTVTSATSGTGAASSGSGSSYDPVPLYSNIDYNYYLDSKAQAHLLPLQQYILEQAKVSTLAITLAILLSRIDSKNPLRESLARIPCGNRIRNPEKSWKILKKFKNLDGKILELRKSFQNPQ